MYYVYALRSVKDGNLYIGQTNDVFKRLKLHNAGKVRSTALRKPFKLIGYKVYKTRNEARWVEHMLKKHGDRKKQFIKELEASGP